jgi:uncharacterized protein YmfQ (DUF2313 family)
LVSASRRSDSDYAAAWTQLLPSGSAWPRNTSSVLQNFLLGMSGIWGQQPVNFPSLSVDGRAADMVEIEADPRFAIEMLPDWETAFGLPDTCLAEPLTIGDRHKSLVARYIMLGAQDPGFMIGIAQSIGYAVQLQEHSPFMCGVSQVGDTRILTGPSTNYRWELGDTPVRQSYTVLVLNPRLSWFQCGAGQCGVDHMLTIGLYTDLECMMTRIKPAHTMIFFNLSGVTVNGQFAGIHYTLGPPLGLNLSLSTGSILLF